MDILLIIILIIIILGCIIFVIICIAKQNNKIIGGTSEDKCDIQGEIKAGYGGGFIIITEGNEVYKIFLTMISKFEGEVSPETISKKRETVLGEIHIFKTLKKTIIDPGISDHIVEYIQDFECDNPDKLFESCPDTLMKHITSDQKKPNCSIYYSKFPINTLIKPVNILQIQYYEYDAWKYLNSICNMKASDIITRLDIIIFQITHTILAIKSVYPYFIHRDLHIGNILGTMDTKNKNLTYTYNNLEYKIPFCEFYPKINDFGIAYLDINNKTHEFSSDSFYVDLYIFLMSIYYFVFRNNFITNVINRKKFNKIRTYLNHFMKFNTMDYVKKLEYNRYSGEKFIFKYITNIYDDNFVKDIKIKHPKWLIENYFNKYLIDK